MPIHYRDDAFHVGEKLLGLPAMLDLIDKYPERFSPDVLTRPIWQSYLFPVVAQSGGPSEIAYFFQIGRLFELFGLVQPYYFARAGATIVEKRQEDIMSRLNISYADLAGDVEQLVNRIAEESFPEDIKTRVGRFREGFNEEFEDYAGFLIDYEKNLEPMIKQTRGKIDFALSNLEKKILSQHKKRMETTRGQIYRMAEAIFPDDVLQERKLNINYFISKYGFGVVDFIFDSLDVGTDDHQLIYMSRFTK
jgi:uncharacterized protein YllA (UPF0747 family)